MATCKEAVGNRPNPNDSNVTFPCSLPAGHPGPHFVQDVDRSVRERRIWETAQVGSASIGDGPIPVGSSEATQVENLLRQGAGALPPNTMERITLTPPRAAPQVAQGEPTYLATGLLFEVDEDFQSVVDLTLKEAGLVAYGGALYFAEPDETPPLAAYARLAMQVIEEHPELSSHVIMAQIVTLSSTSDLTITLRSFV